MAVTFKGVGSWADNNATTQTVTLPTHAAGDMLIVRAACKPFGATPVINTSGWNQVAAGYASGAVANGNGTGSMKMIAFYKEATSSSETNPVITWNTTAAPGVAVAVVYQKGSTETWVTPAGDGGTDVTSNTAHSATIQSHVVVKLGDVVDFFSAEADDCTMTLPTITQTGVTFDTVTESPAAAHTSTTSNDMAADGGYRTATAGTSSAAAVVTGTLNTAETGASWMTRLRVQTLGSAFGQANAVIAYTEASDTFTRTEGTGWGESDLGGPWTMTTATNIYQVDGAAGFTLHSAVGNTRRGMMPQVRVRQTEVYATIWTDKIASGSDLEMFIIGRQLNTTETDYIAANIKFTTTQTVIASVVHRIANSNTTPTGGSNTTVAGLTHAALAKFDVRLRITDDGTTTTTRVRVWANGTTEPSTWDRTATDTTASLRIAGSPGIRAYNGAAPSNTPNTFYWDNFTVYFPRENAYGQAQARIKAVDTEVAQAQALIKITARGHAQAQALIFRAESYAQARAAISNANILFYDSFTRTISPGLGMADNGDTWTLSIGSDNSDVDGDYGSMAVTRAYNLPNTVISAANGGYEISGQFKFSSNSGVGVKTLSFGPVSGTNVQGVAMVSSSATTISVAEAAGTTIGSNLGGTVAYNINNVYRFKFHAIPSSANATGQSYIVRGAIWIEGNTEPGLSEFTEGNAAGPAALPTTDVLRLRSIGNTIGWKVGELKIVPAGLVRSGQAQAEIVIGSVTYRSHAQSQAQIKQTYFVVAQAQAQIKNTYRGHGQTQAQIKNTYRGHGQANVLIDGANEIHDTFTRETGGGWGTSDNGIVWTTAPGGVIEVDGEKGYLDTSDEGAGAYALQVSFNDLEFNVQFKLPADGVFYTFWNANAMQGANDTILWIEATTGDIVYGESGTPLHEHVAYIPVWDPTSFYTLEIRNYHHSSAHKTLDYRVYKVGDAAPEWSSYVQIVPSIANKWGTFGVSGSTTSSQIPIWVDNLNVQDYMPKAYGQAAALIKNTYFALGQSQAWIENIYFGLAQSQATIKAVTSKHGQAQARIGAEGPLTWVKDTFTRANSVPPLGTPDIGPAWENEDATGTVTIDGNKIVAHATDEGSTFVQADSPVTILTGDVQYDFLLISPDPGEVLEYIQFDIDRGLDVTQFVSVGANGPVTGPFSPANFSIYLQGPTLDDFVSNTGITIELDTWYTIKLRITPNELKGKIFKKGFEGAWQVSVSEPIIVKEGLFLYAQINEDNETGTSFFYIDNFNATEILDVAAGQTQARIKQTYFVHAQAQAAIALPLVTRYAHGQAQAQIKQVYSVHAQAQARIKNTYFVHAQAQARIKQVYYSSAQANAWIEQTYFGHAQAAAWIENTYFGLAQAQAQIKTIYYVHAQAQARIKNTYRAIAQSQAWIEQTYPAHAQTQANIKAVGRGHGQAQADIKQTYYGLAQAQADIKQVYFVYAQAQARIKNTYYSHAQANAWIKQTYHAHGQAMATIRGNAFGQAQGWIEATYFALGQSQAQIKNTYYGLGQSQAWIEQTYYALAQAQAQIKTTYTQHAQVQAWIEQTYFALGQAQGYIKVTGISASGQAQALISNTYYISAQAQAKINAYGVSVHGQAQANIRFNGNAVHGQAQAKINAFGYPQHGQAQGSIRATYNSSGQAQTTILAVGSASAQAQATIEQTYSAVAQANANIKATNNVHGQANAYIILSGRIGTGQAQATIRDTYESVAQAQAHIRRIEYGLGQAQGTIKTAYFVHAQAQAAIEQVYYAVAQAQARIRDTYYVSAQAQAKINAYGISQSAQAQAYILSGLSVHGQANAYIKAIGINQHGQAQGTVKTAYTQHGQSQADIKQTYYIFGQANALIGTRVEVCGQAQAQIKQSYTQSAQAQGLIKQTYKSYGQAQGLIKATYSQHGQANAQIILLRQGYGQAQASIEQTYSQHAQARALIRNTYSSSANAQSTIKVTVNAYAQAQAVIVAFSQQYAQAQALITSGTAGYGQAQAQILATYVSSGQAQALISKSAGYGQAQAVIIYVYFFGTLEIEDGNAIDIILSDSVDTEQEITDEGRPQLTLEDSTFNLTLEDSGIDLILSDVNY